MVAKADQHGKKEPARRIDALLRGAFSGPPQAMKDIPRKRPKVARKRKAKKPGQ